MGGKFGSLNKPTSGATHEKALQRGEHPYQVYSLGTPNGQKVTVFLEESGLDYDAWYISIMEGDQFGSGFVAANPNSKIPAMLDYSDCKPAAAAAADSADAADAPIRVFESAAILLYLADKHAMFVPATTQARARAECMNWLFWLQGAAPYIGGGVGHFYHCKCAHNC
jgi:GST-like protein